MPEVPVVTIDAPIFESRKLGKLQPIIPQGFNLNRLPETHRVYQRNEFDEKIYLKRGPGDNFVGYSNYDSAIRATQHIVANETTKTNQQLIDLEAQPDTDRAQIALLLRHRAVVEKYGVLGRQFSALKDQRRILELVEVDLQDLALEVAQLQRQQVGVLSRVRALTSGIQSQFPDKFEPSPLPNQGAGQLQKASEWVRNFQSKVQELLTKNPLVSYPGWVLVPYNTY